MTNSAVNTAVNNNSNSSGDTNSTNYSNGEVDIFGAQKPDRFDMGDSWTFYGANNNGQNGNQLRRGLEQGGASIGNGQKIFLDKNDGKGAVNFWGNYNDNDWIDEGFSIKNGLVTPSSNNNSQTAYNEYINKIASSKYGKDLMAVANLNTWKNSGGYGLWDNKGDDVNHPYDSNQIGLINSDGKTAQLLITGLTGSYGDVSPFDLTVSVNGKNMGDVVKYATSIYLKYNLGQYVITKEKGSGVRVQKAQAIINNLTIISPTCTKAQQSDPAYFGLPLYKPADTITNTSQNGNVNGNSQTGI